jgi:hypothetical protein
MIPALLILFAALIFGAILLAWLGTTDPRWSRWLEKQRQLMRDRMSWVRRRP